MRAYGTAGGGVMFVPDEIDDVPACSASRKAPEDSKPEKRIGLFGRRRAQQDLQKAA